MSFQAELVSRVEKQHCTRIKLNGDRCGNYPVRGATVCRFHGAAKGTPARRKAEEQLRSARDELMEILLGIARDATSPDQYRAITWALERSGFKAGIEVSHSLKPWQEVLQGLASVQPAPTLPPGRDVIEGETA